MESQELYTSLKSLLRTVYIGIKANKRLRNYSNISGLRSDLVGFVEFKTIDELNLVAAILEVEFPCYYCVRNNNLYLLKNRAYYRFQNNTLEIYTPRRGRKVKTFLKHLKQVQDNLVTFLSKAREDWYLNISVSEKTLVYYMRPCSPPLRKFWIATLGHFSLRDKIKVSSSTDGSLLLQAGTDDQDTIETLLGIIPKKEIVGL
jgi:hypothetical protein